MMIACKTDKGKRRRKNDYAVMVDKDIGLFLPADGSGKYPDGEIAGELVVRKVHGYLGDRGKSLSRSDDICRLLPDAIIHAERTLKKKAKADIISQRYGDYPCGYADKRPRWH